MEKLKLKMETFLRKKEKNKNSQQYNFHPAARPETIICLRLAWGRRYSQRLEGRHPGEHGRI